MISSCDLFDQSPGKLSLAIVAELDLIVLADQCQGVIVAAEWVVIATHLIYRDQVEARVF
jgi:hypothetical protein